ncbi:MAG: EAL domain-containing protein, partial [Leptospiraceae bacterium]|nr:EAL domain-containing protein [Leptospiraceae bacterium]
LISSLKDENRIITNYIGICKDLTENKNKEEYILKLSYFDPVTGLPNRVLIMEKINNLITDSNKHTKFAILILDLDKFKNINDTLGHGVGNKLLVQVANRLRDIFKNDYNLSRIGGDEFMILLNYSEEEEIIHISETLLKRISENYKLDNLDLKITTSIGIAFYPKDGKDPETLTKSADTAMYRAKETRNSYRFFTLEMEDQIKHILEIENLLHKALENDEFSVFYQPQISLETMKIVGAESLIRWKTNSGQVISPSEFIPLAEENGLIIPIGSWILETTILQMLDFEKNGIYLNNISVNVSAAQFKHNEFLNSIFQTIDKYKIDPSKLELEITESIAMENPDMVVEITKKLKEKKIKLSIDDFGTGYSSLSYLKKFHLDKIKIDQSFVKGLGSSQDDEVIVSAIINLANSLKFDIIAEGVENKKQLEFLKQRNCNLIQGYYFSKPLNSKDFFSLVKKFNKL